jgi:protein-disulfide isomerase
MTKLYMVLGAVAVVGVGAVGYSVGQGNGGAATTPVAIEGIDQDLERLADMAQGVTLGDENAPITIIEFGDYSCPGCAMFNAQVKPQVQSLVQNGKAKFVFYDFPLTSIHPNSFLAARAARCAGDQDRYWDYHDNLFRTQPRWAALASAGGLFEEYSRSLDMDDGAFASCLNSDKYAELVTANMQLGEVLGVPSTPTILVEHDAEVVQVEPDFASIQAKVDELLTESEPESESQ